MRCGSCWRFTAVVMISSNAALLGGRRAPELQLSHGGEYLGTFHQMALLSLSYRAQSAVGACRSRSASGVMIVIEGAGSRRRARMLMTTSAE